MTKKTKLPTTSSVGMIDKSRRAMYAVKSHAP